MRNSWRIFTRDLGRLGKVPLAWVIIIGALITPSLYAWFNIAAFWDPFGNTKNLSISVVNLDRGASSSLTGELNVGDQLVAQLKDNDDLGWRFQTEAEAMEAVKSGESYAAFIVPADFSEDLLTITTGSFTQPKLKYYVNEKANGVAPEITDTGATTVQTQMNDAFTQQVASAATTAIKEGGETVEDKLLATQSRAIDELGSASKKVTETRKHLADLQTGIEGTREGLTTADTTLADMEATLADLRVDITDATELADQAQAKLLEFTSAATTAYVDSTSHLADAAAASDAAVSKLTRGMDKAQARLEAQIEAVQDSSAGIADVRAFLDDPALPIPESMRTDLLNNLKTLEDQLDLVLSALELADDGLATGATDLQGAADAANTAFQQAADSAKSVNEALATHVPALQKPMTELTSAARSLSAAFESQSAMLSEARELLSGLDDQLVTTEAALTSLDGDLGVLVADLGTATTDLRALGDATAWKQLSTVTSLNPEQIAEFMSTPVVVKQHTLFPTNSYGSLMGSLFINLSLWIGAFVLVVILKLEVDRGDLPKTTERQRYMGRWLLFAMIAVMQAVVLSIGNLIIGVQHVNVFAFIATPILIGLCYLSIIYALSVTLGYIGKGLCIILVIMQIPGASGIYPIELMPQFFQSLYPFFPFTYGIDAMREVVSGFAGFAYLKYMGVLLLFAAFAFFLGLVLRKSVANLTRLFTQEVGATELFTTEEGAPSGRGYRLTHLLRALASRATYQERLAKHALPFARSYRKVRAGLVSLGLLGMVLIFALSVWLPERKTEFVGVWIIWLLLIFALLVTLEYIRYSFKLSTEVGKMPESEIRHELEEIEAQR